MLVIPFIRETLSPTNLSKLQQTYFGFLSFLWRENNSRQNQYCALVFLIIFFLTKIEILKFLLHYKSVGHPGSILQYPIKLLTLYFNIL